MRNLPPLGLFLLMVLVAQVSSAGEISSALSQKMSEKAGDEPITVVVFLHDTFDIHALDRGLHQQKAPLAHRHQVVIESLQETARAAQADLTAELAAALRRGQILEYRPYWIINAVRLKAGQDVIRAVAARPDVDLVDLNPQIELIEPNSRRQADERGIGITPGLVNIGARRVWDELGIRGEGTLIGSLDTGVDGTHPALADRWRGNHAPWQECWLDVVGEVSEFPIDEDGHGTHCTGTMTGVAEDDTIGVAPAAQWIAANPIEQYASPEFDADIIACFEWFADPDGDPLTLDDVPDVVQNSWGVHEGFGYYDCDSRWWEAIDACEAAGPVLIFAAGNEGAMSATLRSPADRSTSLLNCFSVGATDHTAPFEIAGFSSRGPAGRLCGPDENNIKPEVSGPGVDIYSAQSGGGYFYLDGTSMATPHVCGVVALMRSANPDLDVTTIKEVLMGSCHDLGTPGEDNNYGHGFIDAYAAVSQVLSGFGQVEGLVTTADTGWPLAGVEVGVAGSYWSATTDESGYYSFRIPAGTQTIEASLYGYEMLEHQAEISVDENNQVDLVMNLLPRVTVSGIVYLPGGNPIDGGTPVSAASISIENTPEEAVLVDEFGQYEVSLPIGSDYLLSVTSGVDGYLSQTVPFYADLNLDFYLNGGNAEGFESGDLEWFGWSTAGAAGFTVQGEEVHSGNWAARSGDIEDGEYSQIYSFVNFGQGGEFAFWYKTSCETENDYLRVTIGNTEVGQWSGESDWTQVSMPVTGGTQTLRIRYQKDGSGSAGQDAVWVDDLIFPVGTLPAAKLVASPTTVAVELSGPDQVSEPGYLFNMGGENLTWSVSESAGWLNITPNTGVMTGGDYQELLFNFDAYGLMDGVHTALVTVNSDDPANPAFSLQARLELSSGLNAAPDLPNSAFALLGAVPNPFNPTTVVRFTLPTEQPAQLEIYDVRGHLVRSLVDEIRSAGLHEITWDGQDNSGSSVASGTYFARLRAGDLVDVKALALVR